LNSFKPEEKKFNWENIDRVARKRIKQGRQPVLRVFPNTAQGYLEICTAICREIRSNSRMAVTLWVLLVVWVVHIEALMLDCNGCNHVQGWMQMD
jgi:hypothetical protein